MNRTILAFALLAGSLSAQIITPGRGGGGASPAGSNGDPQCKNGTAFGVCSYTNLLSAWSGTKDSSTVPLGDGTMGTISAAFSSVTAGTNTAALIVGTGGTLTYSGTGAIDANKLSGTAITGVTGTGDAVLSNSPTFSGTVIVPNTVVKTGAFNTINLNTFSGVALWSTGAYNFASGADAQGPWDSGFQRKAAGKIELWDGNTDGNTRDLSLRSLIFNGSSIPTLANGQCSLALTANTTVTITCRGSDGTLRSTTLTIS